VLNRKQALKVLTKGLEAKELQTQRDLLLNEVDTLKARITIKEMMISNLNGQKYKGFSGINNPNPERPAYYF
jgi:hypothetical protein